MIPADPALITPAPAPAEPPTNAPAAARALIEAQMAVLSRLTQMGMDIAEAVRRDACGAGPDNVHNPTPQLADPTPPRDPSLSFARAARAVRMTIALQSRLAKDLAALDRADENAQAARKTRRRIRLSQLVEQAARDGVAARREAGGQYWADEDAVEDEIEQLSSEAYERLIDAEDGEFDGTSFDAVVASVARDLGLSPYWTARLCAAVAAPAESGDGVSPGIRLEPSAARPPGADPDPLAPPPRPAWAEAPAQPRAPP